MSPPSLGMGITSKLSKMIPSPLKRREPGRDGSRERDKDKEGNRDSVEGRRSVNENGNENDIHIHGETSSPTTSRSASASASAIDPSTRVQLRRAQSSAIAALNESQAQRDAYGEVDYDYDYDHDSSASASTPTPTPTLGSRLGFTPLSLLASSPSQFYGKPILFRARIHTIRAVSGSLVFVVFRQQMETVQGVVQYREREREQTTTTPPSPSAHMVHWASRLRPESIVHVKGVVQRPRTRKGKEGKEGEEGEEGEEAEETEDTEDTEEVRSTSVHNAEIRVIELHVISRVEERVPFTVYDADLSAEAGGRMKGKGGEDDDDDDDDENDDKQDKDDKESKLASLTPYITDRARLGSRIIHLRSASAQAVFRIQSTMSTTFRERLSKPIELPFECPGLALDFVGSLKDIFGCSRSGTEDGYEGKSVVRTRIPPFLEIHTPKLQGGASESGASVFKLKYFGRLAFLAQSPQLFKQMAIAADFGGGYGIRGGEDDDDDDIDGTGGVFEVGPVFRAENSNTKRHLTEYTGLDLEMGIEREYHEVMLVVDSVLKAIFREVYGKRRREVEVVKKQFGVGEDLVWREKTVVMAFADGIQMLIDDGWVDDSGKPPRKDEDLSTRAEIRLGELVKEKYKTDYYILDLFPKSARPFYTMPASPSTQSHLSALHPNSPAPGGPCGPLTHSFDIFVRGQEITTGGQRIHTYPALLDSMAAHDISARGLEEYLDGFKWGAPPHGGAGIGLERLVMLVLGLGDVRYGSMYPRDPRSLPEPPRGLEGVRHVEASTLGVSRTSPLKTIKCICHTQSTPSSSSATSNTPQTLGVEGLGLSDLSLDTAKSKGGTDTPASTHSARTVDTTTSTTSRPRHPPRIVAPSPLHQSLIPDPSSGELSQQRLAPPARSLPPIPSLIANYGDAANTSWLDDRYLVWRDVVSGGAIGFVPSSSGYAIVVGDPLCDESQYVGVVGRFLRWLARGEREEKKGKGKGKRKMGVKDKLKEKTKELGLKDGGDEGEGDTTTDGEDGDDRLGFVERKRVWVTEDEKEEEKDRKTAQSTTASGKSPGIVHPRTNDSVLSGLSTNSTLDPSSESTITPGPTSPSTQNQNLTYPSPLPPLKPIWLLASSHLERILGSRLSWSSFTCIAESRVELEGEVPGALEDKEVARKVRKAESEGVSVGVWFGRDGFRCKRGEEMNEYDLADGIRVVDDEAEESKAIALSLKHAIDERIEEWKEGRKTKGGQVRLTDVEVWRDYIHRVYFVALAPKTKNTTSATEEEEDNIPVSLVVLHQLSPLHGFQVKYALDFPSSSSGSIELTLSSAMHFVASTGSGRLTFGTSATSRLTPTRGLRGMRIKVLSHAYEAISDRMALRGKGEFRKKMGAEEEDVFICFPRGGMGARGAKAVLDFCVAES